TRLRQGWRRCPRRGYRETTCRPHCKCCIVCAGDRRSCLRRCRQCYQSENHVFTCCSRSEGRALRSRGYPHLVFDQLTRQTPEISPKTSRSRIERIGVIQPGVTTPGLASRVHSQTVGKYQIARIRSGDSADRCHPTRRRNRAVLWRPIERGDRPSIGIFRAFKCSKRNRTADRQGHRRRSADGRGNIEHLSLVSTEASHPRLCSSNRCPCPVIRVAHRCRCRRRLPRRCTNQKMPSPGGLMESHGKRGASSSTGVVHPAHAAVYIRKVRRSTSTPTAVHRQRKALVRRTAHPVAGRQGQHEYPTAPRRWRPAQCCCSIPVVYERHT